MTSISDEKATETSSSHSAEAEGAASDAQISEKVLHELIAEEEEDQEVAVTLTTTMSDPPTISPMDPSPSPSLASGLQLPSHPARNDHEDGDGGASLEALSQWGSIADNASKKSSSSTRAKAARSSSNGGTSSRGKREINGTIFEDEGDLPSLSGERRNCEPPDANTSFRQQRNAATAHDPPEYGYRKKVHHATASTGIHNIQMNSRGHVYLDGEDNVANGSSGPPGNRMGNIEDEDNETSSTRYSANSNNTSSSTNSPPPPSDYFNQPSRRQMYPAEPRGGVVDILSGNYEESSFVGSSETTSLASNTTRSSEAVNTGSHSGGGGDSGEYYDENRNSALNRHLSKSSTGTTNGRSNGNGRKKQDPQDYTETIKKQDPQVMNVSDHSDAYSSRQASRRANDFDATERVIRRQQQQQRVVYASSAKRDLYNHTRNGYQDKAKDSDLESGRASHQQHQQRVRFAEKMFSSRGNASSSSSHQVVVGNVQSSSSSASAYGLSWRDRSIASDSSVTSKSSIDSQSSSSSFSNRSRGSSKDSNSGGGGGVGRNVVSLLGNGLWNIFEGLHSSPSAPSSNNSTSSSISSGSGSGRGTSSSSNNKRARFKYLKRNTAILAILSLMMLATIGSYYDAFFEASNNGYNEDSRGLGIEHDMRPPAMGLMDNVPHQAMLKGSVGSGVNNNDAGGNNIMGGGSGVLPPLVENGQVVDWDKVPPHLRGYYSKVFGVQGGANAGQQQQQQQAMMQSTQQAQVHPDDPNAAAQAIQSVGNEAIGAESSFKVPTLEQHEFQEHIQEIEGAIPFLGQQQQEQMQQEQDEQMQQQQQQQQKQKQEQLMQQDDEQVAKEELAKQELEQVHLRQQAEAEQQRAQAEADQQQREQQQQEEQSEEIDAAHEEKMEREEEERRKQAEEEALRKTGIAEEGAQQENMSEGAIEQQRDESEAATNEGNALDEVNSEAESVVPAPEPAVGVGAGEGGQIEAEGDNNATLESLQSELSELMDMVKQRTSDTG